MACVWLDMSHVLFQWEMVLEFLEHGLHKPQVCATAQNSAQPCTHATNLFCFISDNG